jgi:hypothetical protein
MMDSPGIRSWMALATVNPPIPESKMPNGLLDADGGRAMIKDSSFLMCL